MNKTPSNEMTIEKVVETYTTRIKRAARKFINLRMRYDHWLLDDLVQQGYLGLLEAFKRYDFKTGSDSFWNYARKFVKGRMIDYTVKHFNYIRPSKKVNSVMLQIKNRN